MKTNEQKLKRLRAENKVGGKKRMWITREQINIAKRENDQMRRYWKENGADKPPTHVTFHAGGDVPGHWLYGWAKYNGLTSEQGDVTLKRRKRQLRKKKLAGRISTKEWSRMATI